MLTKEPMYGICGQISWQRLEQMFRDTGEITSQEKIVAFKADETFLRFKVERIKS